MVMLVLNIGSYGDGSDGGNAGDDDDDDDAWARRRVMERPSE